MKTEAIFIDRVRALKAVSVNTQAVNSTCKGYSEVLLPHFLFWLGSKDVVLATAWW